MPRRAPRSSRSHQAYVAKHSHAGCAEVTGYVQDGMLRVEVHDDGIGGTDPTGHGLVGMGGMLVAATLLLSAG